jgi:hypothetical protein
MGDPSNPLVPTPTICYQITSNQRDVLSTNPGYIYTPIAEFGSGSYTMTCYGASNGSCPGDQHLTADFSSCCDFQRNPLGVGLSHPDIAIGQIQRPTTEQGFRQPAHNSVATLQMKRAVETRQFAFLAAGPWLKNAATIPAERC